jgi:pseudaminic acid cytidylyltransferase
VLPFAGKPMIAHSIECARRSGLFDRIIVSSDDAEITRVAQEYGAEVPFRRPAALADDHTGTTEVIAHAVSWLRGEGTGPSAVCCIYATAPFLCPGDLEQGLRVLEAGTWHYVFAATTFPSPIFRSFKTGAEGAVEMFFPDHFKTRSQDLPEAYHDAGQFYWGRPDAWVGHARIFASESTVVKIPRWRVHDIDTVEDWKRAELVWKALRSLEPGGDEH